MARWPSLKPAWWVLAIAAGCAPLVARLSDGPGLTEPEYLLSTLTCVAALALALRAPGTGVLRSFLPAALLGLAVPIVPLLFLGVFPPVDGTYRSTEAPNGRGLLVLDSSTGRMVFPEDPAGRDWVLLRDWDGCLGAHRQPTEKSSGYYELFCMDCPTYVTPELWVSRDPFGPGIRVLDVRSGAVTRYAPSTRL